MLVRSTRATNQSYLPAPAIVWTFDSPTIWAMSTAMSAHLRRRLSRRTGLALKSSQVARSRSSFRRDVSQRTVNLLRFHDPTAGESSSTAPTFATFRPPRSLGACRRTSSRRLVKPVVCQRNRRGSGGPRSRRGNSVLHHCPVRERGTQARTASEAVLCDRSCWLQAAVADLVPSESNNAQQ